MAEGEVDEVVSKQLEQLHIQETSTGAPEAAEPIAGERRKGTVRWFNASKGFGFIQPEGAEGDTEDLFVHQVRTESSFRLLNVIHHALCAFAVVLAPDAPRSDLFEEQSAPSRCREG